MENGFFFRGVQSSIINGDIFATDMLAAGSVDLAVTSPPYNVGIRYNSHDDRVTYNSTSISRTAG